MPKMSVLFDTVYFPKIGINAVNYVVVQQDNLHLTVIVFWNYCQANKFKSLRVLLLRLAV